MIKHVLMVEEHTEYAFTIISLIPYCSIFSFYKLRLVYELAANIFEKNLVTAETFISDVFYKSVLTLQRVSEFGRTEMKMWPRKHNRRKWNRTQVLKSCSNCCGGGGGSAAGWCLTSPPDVDLTCPLLSHPTWTR